VAQRTRLKGIEPAVQPEPCPVRPSVSDTVVSALPVLTFKMQVHPVPDPIVYAPEVLRAIQALERNENMFGKAYLSVADP
jgi:hypothetical protein